MDPQVVTKLAEQAASYQELVKWLLGLLAGSGAVIAALFWQLIKAKDDVNEAYKEVAPIATASLESAKALEMLLARADADRGAMEARREAQRLYQDKSIVRLEEVTMRLEEAERRRQP